MPSSSSYYDDRPDTRGLVLKRRSEVRPDEMIVAPASAFRRQELVLRGSSTGRYDSSDNSRDRGRNMAMQRYRDPRDRDASQSEASIPPRSRNRRRSHDDASRSKRRNQSKSSSSSDLGSSTEDEKKCKEIKKKKYLSYGFAGVATIHAAATLHSSIEKRKKRKEDVETGEISPDEAQRLSERAKWQDAGAVGLSALGLWHVWSESKECWELRKEHMELEEGREERHRKREERRRRRQQQQQRGGGSGST